MREEIDRLGHELGRSGANPDDGQLSTVYAVCRDLTRVGEHEHRSAGPDRVERGCHTALTREDRAVDRHVRRWPCPAWIDVDGEDLVATMAEDGSEQVPDEAVTDDEHPACRARAVRRGAHTPRGSTIVPCASSTVSGSSTHPWALGSLREPAWPDGGCRERRAQRLVVGQTLLAGAACVVVDQRDTAPVGGLGDDLVPEDGSGSRGIAELLDVGSAQPARENADDLSRPVWLGDLA